MQTAQKSIWLHGQGENSVYYQPRSCLCSLLQWRHPLVQRRTTIKVLLVIDLLLLLLLLLFY